MSERRDDGHILDDVLSLIEDIYEAAARPEHWTVALTRLADATGKAEATMGGQTSTQLPMLISPRTDPDYIRRYMEYYGLRNPMQAAVFQQPVGKVVLDSMVLDLDEFHATEFYQDWCRPQGLQSGAAVNLAAEGGWRATVMVSGAADQDERTLSVLTRVAPHLRRAFQLNQILQTSRAMSVGALTAFEYVDRGVLVLDRAGTVRSINATADRILDQGDGLHLRAGQLSCDFAAETQALGKLLANCGRGIAETSGATLTITRSMGRGPLSLLCIPFPSNQWWPGFEQQLALIFITDRDAQLEQRGQRLRSRFGLTPAEAALAWEIAKSGGRQEAAEKRGVSLSTARTQLSSIFDKTGVRRQAELVRLLLDTLDD